jgi:hypothetical protein
MLAQSFLISTYTFLKKNHLNISLIFGIICFTILLVIKLKIAFAMIPDICGSESSSIHPIQRVVAGLPLYTNPEEPPFLITQYSPMYFYIVGGIYRLLNFDPLNVHRVYVFSRLFSLGFLLISMGIIILTLRRILKINLLPSVLLCLLLFHLLSFWGTMASRPDSLLFMLFTVFIYFVASAFHNPQKRDFYLNLAIFTSVFSFFCKQNGMIYPVILGFYFLYLQQWKTLIRLVLIGAITFVICTFAFSFFEPKAFFQNVIGGVVNSIEIGGWYGFVMKPLVFPFAIIITGGFVIGFKWIVFQKGDFKAFLGWAVFILFIFDLVTGLKGGSNVSYFTDFLYIALLIIFIEIYTFELPSIAPQVFLSVFAMCTILHCCTSVTVGFNTTNIEYYHHLFSSDTRITEYIEKKQALKKDEYIYLGTLNTTYYLWYLRNFLFKNNIVAYEELNMLTAENKVFNFNRFDDLIKSGQLRFVIVEKGVSPTNLFKAPFERKGAEFKLKTSMEYVDIYENIKKFH